MKQSKHILNIILWYLGTTLLLSCQDNLLYASYSELPSQQWESRDTISFTIPPVSEDKQVSLSIGARTNQLFDYTSITVRVWLECDGQPANTYLMPIHMDKNESTPYKPQAPLYSDHLSIPQPIRLKANKPYTLRVAHIMRQHALNNISHIGIIIEDKETRK